MFHFCFLSLDLLLYCHYSQVLNRKNISFQILILFVFTEDCIALTAVAMLLVKQKKKKKSIYNFFVFILSGPNISIFMRYLLDPVSNPHEPRVETLRTVGRKHTEILCCLQFCQVTGKPG